MIYVLIRETGEYSSYNVQPLFASSNKETIEAKQKEFEAHQKIVERAADEYEEARNKIKAEHPYRADLKMPNPFSPEYNAWAAEVKQRSDTVYALLQDAEKKTNEKYGLAENELNDFFNEVSFSIWEVMEP